MAGENLIWTIGANTAPFRGELKLAQEQLKQLGRQVSAAVKKGDVALAESLSKQYGTMAERVDGLSRSLRGTAGALDRVTAAGRRTEVQFRRMSLSANSFGRLVSGAGGGLAGGLVGAAVFAGLREVKQLLDEQIERINKIRDLARETGQKPVAVAAAQRIAQSLGEDADVADKMLSGVAESFAKVKAAAGSPINAAGVRDLTKRTQDAADASKEATSEYERGVRVLKGGSQIVFDLANAYKMLGINTANYKDTQEDQFRLQKDVFKAFVDAANQKRFGAAQLNELSKAIFKGEPAETALKVAPALIANLDAEIAKIQDSFTKAQEAAEKLRVSQGQLKNATEDATRSAVTGYAEAGAAINNATTAVLEGAKAEQKAMDETWKAVISGNINDQIQTNFADLPNFFQGITGTIGKLWNGLWSGLISSAHAAEVGVKGSGAAMSFSFKEAAAGATAALGKIQAAAVAAQDAVDQVAAAASRAQSATGGGGVGSGFGVGVFRGPGTGFPSPYGPVDTGAYGYGPRGSGFRETASPSRGGDPREGGTSPYLQSYAPGMSNYQALPPHMVSPIEYSAAQGWGSALDAANAAKDAAIASRQAAEASQTAVDGWVDQVKTVGFGGFASGGMVTGPGSGTSDSIMARLSNGEFVMRAAAVRSLGAGFLSNLNRFAGGGMVMPSRGVPSFADGGLVAAGAGGQLAASFHFESGSSFRLSGPADVVGAMVKEANRQQVRSAGVKPSWFAGRPGG